MKNYQGKKVLILGLGISGRSAARFLLERGAVVYGEDDRLEQAPCDWDALSLLVVSPGIPRSHPTLLRAKEKGIEIIGEIELAAREMTQPMIGITGTNGKTTVSELVTHCLKTSGQNALLLGNSGIPLTSELPHEFSGVIVVELSSYQLETLSSQVFDCGVILNITPDHLDRYEGMEDYAKAKINLSKCIKDSGSFFVSEQVFETYQKLLTGSKPKIFNCCKEKIEKFLPDPYRNKSGHDVENIMAAYTLCHEMGVSKEEFFPGLETFKKPPHRIEFVRSVKGVSFYNDSKGTNLDSVIRAVESMPGKVILIAGGKSKGGGFTPWLHAFGDKVVKICAIGEAQGSLEEDLGRSYSLEKCETLESAIEKAFSFAKEGENVLLSPGCASFDMFKNFEHRGDCFKEAVRALEE